MALPNEYTRVEYIKCTGTQYIDTGFIPNQDTRVVCKVKLPVGTSTNWLFGTRQSSTAQKFTFAASTNGYYTGGFGGGTSCTYSTACNTTEAFTIDANKQNWTVITNSIIETKEAGAYTTFTAYSNLLLFACNTKGAIAYSSNATIYSCQIYDNGTLVRDFIPCRNASGDVGLYDKANDAFYTNKGTGIFSAGADILYNYKVVDTTQLDDALTVTANAIRAKGETTEAITWNSTLGFASAISAISAGGDGSNVAFGEFIVNQSSTNNYGKTHTVSGLGFEPTKVFVYLVGTYTDDQMQADAYDDTALFATYGFNGADTAVNKTYVIHACLDWYTEEGYDEDTEEYYENEYYYTRVNRNNYWWTIAPTSDGFTITVDQYNAPAFQYITYGYVAIG